MCCSCYLAVISFKLLHVCLDTIITVIRRQVNNLSSHKWKSYQMSLCDLNECSGCLFCFVFSSAWVRLMFRPFLHAHVFFAVIGCGWLQALRVAGVHLITAKRGGQAHPPQTSPLNIFMYQVGFLISSSHFS